MESKVRRESESVLAKMFRRHDKKGTGFISTSLMPRLISSLNKEIIPNEEELKNVIYEYDPDDTGLLDFDGFSKVTLHFLLKQCRRDSNTFGDKKDITMSDFEG